MKGKKLFYVNSIILFIFFVLNILYLVVEKSIKESQGELLTITEFLLLFIVLILFNKTSFFNFEQKIKKYIAKFSIVAFVFVFHFAIIYFMNWYVFYPFINK